MSFGEHRLPDLNINELEITIMADNTKHEFQWFDIPDGNGGLERKYVKDAEARAAIEALPTYASVATCKSIIDELT